MAKRKKRSGYGTRPRAEPPRPAGSYAHPSDAAYTEDARARRNTPHPSGAGAARDAAPHRPAASAQERGRQPASARPAREDAGHRPPAQKSASQRRPAKASDRKKARRRERLPRNVEPFTFEEAKRRHPRRRREDFGRTGELVYRSLLVVMICAAVFFIASVFFEVKHVKVVGTSKYLPEYVASLSGVENGDKLLFINQYEISKNLFQELPYVKAIKVRHKFPNTVLIEITERNPAAKLVSAGISYIIDENAYLLEYTALGDDYRLPVIHGATPATYEPGRQLTFTDPLMLESLKSILSELVKSDWIENIGSIQMEKIYDISFSYTNRYTVLLGDTSELTYKLSVLEIVLSRLEETDQGIIDVTFPQRARFHPQIS